MTKLSWLLAWRFRGDKRQNGFISFISGSSTLGIALGCFALIVILSVMNGFEKALKEQLLNVIPHGQITAMDKQGVQDWQGILARIQHQPQVAFVQPVIKVTGMLQVGKKMKSAEFTAIDTDHYRNSPIFSHLKTTDWANFDAHPNSILLGSGILQKLKLKAGDKVQLLLPQTDDGQLKALRSEWLTVSGALSFGGELDQHMGLMHLAKAAKIMGVTEGASGLQLYFSDPFTAPKTMTAIANSIHQPVLYSDWTRTQGHLYQDILLVRLVVYIVLTLVIGVACFNIVSAQMMAVAEKQGEIAMLKTMGAQPGLIVRTFMLQGAFNGISGALLGAITGVLCAQHLTEIASAIEHLVGVKFLSADVYFIDFLPSQLRWHDVVLTLSIALGMTLLATLMPAWRAARVDPATVLGH